MYTFSGNDFGAFVFGRKVLLQNPQAGISFVIGKKSAEKSVSESDFWESGIIDICKNKTRFGRIGVVYDRKNKAAKDFCENLEIKEEQYSPQEKRNHTEKNPRIFFIETQILREMAHEGLADSVEFRRLARKQLRPLKHANVDTVFFLENILAEEKTRKILKHIQGTQQRLCFPVDFFKTSDEQSKKRKIEIESDENEDFVRIRAEKILKTKLPH